MIFVLPLLILLSADRTSFSDDTAAIFKEVVLRTPKAADGAKALALVASTEKERAAGKTLILLNFYLC